MHRLQNAFGENVRMTLVLQRHVGSIIDRLDGGRRARYAGQCDRLTALHADFQTDHLCGRGGPYCRGRGRGLWLWVSAAEKCESEKCQRGVSS